MLLFAVDIAKCYFNFNEMLWPLSLGLSLLIPPILYLYATYVTSRNLKFTKKDFIHFIPSVLLYAYMIVFTLSSNGNMHVFSSLIDINSEDFKVVKFLFTKYYLVSMIIYPVLALIRVYTYKRSIENSYSFNSSKINLLWLRFLIVCYPLMEVLIALVAARQMRNEHDWDILGYIVSLLIIYVLSYAGVKQRQLDTEFSFPLTGSRKDDMHYVKSGLTDKQAEIYAKELIGYMNTSKVWQDPELSLAKLSKDTGIQKHFITETLNEYLHKNFYTFINEYRTVYAKELITSPKYKNWSFLAIAFECGFNSKTSFNNFFKKNTGMTPTEYKKSVK